MYRHFVPGRLGDYLRPEWNFRGGLGYEWRRFRFSAESGFFRASGTHPDVLRLTGLDIILLDIDARPLLFTIGYGFPLLWGFGIRPELGLGLLFSRAGYYPTVLDLLLDNKTEAAVQSLFSTFKLSLTYDLPGGFAGLYAGGGADLLLETGGAFPLPFFQAGLSLRPFALAARTTEWARARRTSKPPPEPPLPLLEPGEESPTLAEEKPALAEAAPVPSETGPASAPEIRLLGVVFFEPDGAVLRESSRPSLDAAAAALAANPQARIIIRGYAAPFGSLGGQESVSAGRARFCGGYLQSVHGAAPERIHLEWFGAEGSPETGETDTPWEFRRSAELFLETLKTENTKEGT
jgi:outer membrane protein OmpA-like peptidoglycan-associated protein